jgi:hypothetical protein
MVSSNKSQKSDLKEKPQTAISKVGHVTSQFFFQRRLMVLSVTDKIAILSAVTSCSCISIKMN